MIGRIRAGGICVRVGGDCLEYLKRGWSRTEGDTKIKKGGQLGQGVDALKRGGGGDGTSLQAIIYGFNSFHLKRDEWTIGVNIFYVLQEGLTLMCNVLAVGEKCFAVSLSLPQSQIRFT